MARTVACRPRTSDRSERQHEHEQWHCIDVIANNNDAGRQCEPQQRDEWRNAREIEWLRAKTRVEHGELRRGCAATLVWLRLLCHGQGALRLRLSREPRQLIRDSHLPCAGFKLEERLSSASTGLGTSTLATPQTLPSLTRKFFARPTALASCRLGWLALACSDRDRATLFCDFT